MDRELLLKILAAAAFYVQGGDTWYRMVANLPEDDYFMATDEDTGEEYIFDYSDVDLAKDVFYTLEAIDPKTL